MTARELVDVLRAIDPETVVTVYDGTNYRHVEKPMVEEFTVSVLLGAVVTEEELA